MTDENAVDACLRQLLIVGGNSNAAKAFRRRISAGGHFRLSVCPETKLGDTSRLA